ncbi:hypothetical protein VOLCADRAFT_92451 [Volvox carteri f. nagariensis]|uniref:Ammonium transporter AmtB-like domain-containing protein n=1 Tax=Volvox carteri f. nagariensis TaxID=3068 RepID=D8TZP6_VOLCA|nr:uncharacterized protein VOLCADRAFT_92451 [Volvox carteri f. nagariensis]EFJ47052.1 hypothetical protein VOLCADRAFT_92451 [Volvox carteri f. nagariensis]|eukprot:XP_002951947.1 hypothetical protein VOLCADRAFT_92451 [Volvox carteri f. nagariensis]
MRVNVFMQIGFVSAESGQGRAKNVRNILLKNSVNIMLCAICWWAVGYAFAYGKTAGGLLGISHFFSDGETFDSKPWFFTWTFCLSAVTIASGCLAERTHLFVYPVYTAVVSIVVHPVVAHWVWGKDSWLNSRVGSPCRFLDFAGGAVVHIVGGLTGLIGAILCGPRMGRFEDGVQKDIPGHDVSSVSLGSLMLWFGWFGFNCGSTYIYMSDGGPAASSAVSRVALNMTLCASAAGMTSLVLASLLSGGSAGTFDLGVCCNGLMAGLSASTANVGFITPWASCITGTLAGLLYVASSRLLVRLGIDDPLDSSAIHCGSGLLGVVISGFLARPSYVRSMVDKNCGGLVYGMNGGTQLGMQLLGKYCRISGRNGFGGKRGGRVMTLWGGLRRWVKSDPWGSYVVRRLLVTIAWTALWSILAFSTLKRFQLLRVDQQTELAGIDNMEHGGPAYPEFLQRVQSSRTGF